MKDPDDLHLRLLRGDQSAFRSLVKRLERSMIGVAMGFVSDRATAEEVVQDTWLAVLEGLDGFEGRSSLKNWIFAILANRARSRAVRDGRMIPLAALTVGPDFDEPGVDPSRFDQAGTWIEPPTPWEEMTPERIVSGKQLLAHVADAIDQLPAAQRSVLVLREVEGVASGEVSAMLGITEGNQRVLLHRARSRIRSFLEQLLAG